MARRPDIASAYAELFPTTPGEKALSGLKLLAYAQIEVNPQPRTTFTPEDIAELANSIAELKARGAGIEGTGILATSVSHFT